VSEFDRLAVAAKAIAVQQYWDHSFQLPIAD
jgi:hypothetical protein